MEFIMGLGDIKNVEDIIKIFYIIVFTHYMNFKLINKKLEINVKNILIIVLSIFVNIIIYKIMRNALGLSYSIIFIILLISISFKKISKYRFPYSLLVTVISLTINYIIFSLSVIVAFIPIILLNIQNTYIGLIFILIINLIFTVSFYKIKRFKKGFIFLQKNILNEYLDILILNISAVVLFCTIILSNYDKMIGRKAYISLIILSIIMFITIQKSLQLYYKQKLQEREVSDIKEEIKSKDREIKELEKENLKLNKINHSLSHKIKSIEYELNQTVIKADMQKEKDLKNKVEKLSKEMQSDIVPVELSKTDIAEIDSMLEYMQSECIKNKIDFQLQVSGNIHHMVNTYIQKENMEILLADLIKNAIIAINHSENINKSILVRLGIIEGFYSLYIYDSGIEFEIDTLINIGNKPSTTHKNDGGTGMGFMNTFDTLRKYKASIVICEYGKQSEERFTKLIKIIFDKKNEYKISSYRDEKIREKDFEKRIKISKESTY